MAIGIIIIITIMLIKYQPVYAVTIDGEEIGCIKSKTGFENLVNEELTENQEENIAYADIKQTPTYELKLVDKQTPLQEQEVLSTIKENADITYFRYVIAVKGEAKEYVNTMEEAEQIVENTKQELGEDIDITITKDYTKEMDKETTIEVATIAENLTKEIKEEEEEQKRIQAATVNGVYLGVNPIQGHITSRYGSRESIRDHTHQGLDIAAKTGTPIKVVADGTVKFSGVMGGYGNLLIIDHGNGVTTYYGHCSKLYVKKGATVTAGDVIGAVGSTGNSTGSHLHLEIRLNGKVLNPQTYVYK